MRIIADLHTHTIASGHAYSSVYENIQFAKKSGIKYLGISEHAPAMGSTTIGYFNNLKALPDVCEDVRLLTGVELNVLDENGTVDLPDALLEYMDYAIASLHIPLFSDGGIVHNTNALINAMSHPKLKIIGHPEDSRLPVDFDVLANMAKERNVLIELNNSSLSPHSFRQNCRERATQMLEACMRHGTKIIINSDSHFCTAVGNFSYALDLVSEIGFPKELIINANENDFTSVFAPQHETIIMASSPAFVWIEG